MARRLATVALAALGVTPVACGGSVPAAPTPMRVTATADGLVPTVATAVPVGTDRVLTVAHAVAGARSVRVAGRVARVVRMDRRLDLALLAVPALHARPIRVGTTNGAAEVRVLRGDRPHAITARVRRHVTARFQELRSDRIDVRPTLELDAAVRAGDSGAPVTDGRGRTIGMVFARAADDSPRAWALDLSALGAGWSAVFGR